MESFAHMLFSKTKLSNLMLTKSSPQSGHLEVYVTLETLKTYNLKSL
jgi:hypothetical protein